MVIEAAKPASAEAPTGLKYVPLEDRTQLVRMLGDLHHLAAVSALSDCLESPEGSLGTAHELVGWNESMFCPVDAVLGRLIGCGHFLLALVGRIGESRLAAALELAESKDAGAVSSLRRVAALEGGFVTFLEKRLSAFDDAMFAARVALGSDRETLRTGAMPIRMDWPHLIECTTGLALIVGGAVATEWGVDFGTPFAVTFGAIEIAVGAEMAAHGCMHLF